MEVSSWLAVGGYCADAGAVELQDLKERRARAQSAKRKTPSAKRTRASHPCASVSSGLRLEKRLRSDLLRAPFFALALASLQETRH